MNTLARVCAIDAGTRNFAFCTVDAHNWTKPLHWQKVDLWPPSRHRKQKPTRQDVIRITRNWVYDNRTMLDECDVIVLERQMRDTFIIMNTVIQTLLFDKCQVVAPVTVGAFYQLPRKRADKKAAGIEAVQLYAEIPKSVKTDDLADAWLMAVYGLIQQRALPKQALNHLF